MKAAILAGGAGMRLRPLTYIYPKVMMPLAGKPILEYTIDYLKAYGIDELVLCVAHLRNRIKEYFGDGGDFGIRISYAEAEQPLGTAGQLATARKHFPETFIAMNGDILTSINLNSLMETHKSSGNIATISLRKFSAELPYGCVELDGKMRLTSFREKPEMTYLANAGLYVFNPRVFDYIKTQTGRVDLERDVFPKMILSGETVAGYREDSYWAHIGTVVDLETLDKEIVLKNGGCQAQLQPQQDNSGKPNSKPRSLGLPELMAEALSVQRSSED